MRELTAEQRATRVLTDSEVLDIAEVACRIEAHYGGEPQDLEWAYEGDDLWIVQTRPITTLGQHPSSAVATEPETASGTVVVRGLGAASGVASGRCPHSELTESRESVRDG